MSTTSMSWEALSEEARELRVRSEWIRSELACLVHATELVEHCSAFLNEIYTLHEEAGDRAAASRLASCLGRIVISAQMVADSESLDLPLAVRHQLDKWRCRLDSLSN